MIFPSLQPQSHFRIGFLSRFLPLDSSKGSIELPNHASNQERSLEIFLEEYKGILYGQSWEHFSFDKLVYKITHIFQQLQCQNFSQNEHHSKSDVRRVEKFDEVNYREA